MVRTDLCERSEAGSDPVTSIIGHEKSALTRDDKMPDFLSAVLGQGNWN